ncbi:hypothetical protein [Thermococcus sp.]|uniref:hypothetical protein n=1 Tax=Thermococcus sp. TaxID=35749 RepID=UPI0026384464|nr:hypothetical protein [Thermococcus sp.]MCD6143523.1 hypothetical protein [Thermococcus sp.]
MKPSRAVISESFLIDPKEIDLREIRISTSRRYESGKIVAYAYDPDFSTSYTNRWIISGYESPIFLEVGVHPKYFVVEIPKGEKVIKEAWDYVEKAEKCFRT